MIINPTLEQFIVHTIQGVKIVPANIPLKCNVSILWYALPRIDGCHRTTGKLETPFDVDFVGWIDGIVVLVRCAKHCNQLVVSA